MNVSNPAMAKIDQLVFRWSGREITVAVVEDETVSSLKRKIQEQTTVQPKRQKLLGLKDKAGKLPTDEHKVAELQLKAGQKIMLMGYALSSSLLPTKALNALRIQIQLALISWHVVETPTQGTSHGRSVSCRNHHLSIAL